MGVGTRWSLRSLTTQAILRFCDQIGLNKTISVEGTRAHPVHHLQSWTAPLCSSRMQSQAVVQLSACPSQSQKTIRFQQQQCFHPLTCILSSGIATLSPHIHCVVMSGSIRPHSWFWPGYCVFHRTCSVPNTPWHSVHNAQWFLVE